MTDPTRAAGPIGERKPPLPPWAYAVANPVVTALLRSPFHGPLSGVMAVITFTGRRSGRRFSTPVGYTRRGDTVELLVHRPWWKNLRGGAEVTLRLRGEERVGRAVAVEDPAELVPFLRRRIADLGGVGRARVRMGLTELAPDRPPTDAELLRAARGAALVRVELRKPAPGG
jgi:hypothetical protein